MARKRSGSSTPVKRAARSARHMPDGQIDFSDVPEYTDEELSRARRVGRPRPGRTKQLIAIRLDPGLLAKLRRLAPERGKASPTVMHSSPSTGANRVAN